MTENEKYFRLGVATGLNMAIKATFNKLWDVMHSEVISQHDALASVTEDADQIQYMLEEQQKQLEKVATGSPDIESTISFQGIQKALKEV